MSNLEKDFKNYCKINKNKARDFVFFNRNQIKIGLNIAKNINYMLTEKKPSTAIIRGISDVFQIMIESASYPDEYFLPANNWDDLFDTKDNAASIFGTKLVDVLKNKYKFKKVEFKNNYIVHIFDLGFTEIAMDMNDAIPEYFCKLGSDKNKIIELILSDFFSQFRTNCVSITDNKTNKYGAVVYDIVPETFSNIKTNHPLLEHIRKFIAKGINRSIILHGIPGSGKTTIADAICNELSLKTLKLRSNIVDLPINTLLNIIDSLKIEAVIIDDFDQINHSEKLLEKLSMLNEKIKITFAVVNSLREFHHAILRPARFDEVLRIDCLDSGVVDSVLGPLKDEIIKIEGAQKKVYSWPIAYINELVKRYKVYPHREELIKFIDELENRVQKQISGLE